MTSLAVSPAKAISASIDWLIAGEPRTVPIRLPRKSAMVRAPVSLATAIAWPLHDDDDRISRAGCGPQSLAAKSSTPSWAKYVPMPLAEICARPVFSGAIRAVSLPAGRTRKSTPSRALSIWPTATIWLKPFEPVS